jgi:hypothetical protein
MFVKSWSLATLVLSGLLMGMSFSHSLEMPSKMRYPADEWQFLQQTLYAAYARIGGAIELAAILAAAALAVLLRDWRPAMVVAIAGALCLAIAFFGIWVPVTRKVNAQVSTWTFNARPIDWARWRAKWELSHVARFLLQFLGFALLAVATLISPFAEA